VSCRIRVALIGFVLALASPSHGAEPTKAERDALRRDLGEVEEWLAGARKKRDSTAQALRRVELEAAEIKSRIRDLDQERRSLEAMAIELAKEHGTLERSVHTHQQAIVGYLHSAHALGGNSLVKLILTQQDPAKVPRMLVYYGYLARARTAALGEVHALLDALEEKDAAIAVNRRAIVEREAALERSFDQLAETRETRAGVLASLSRDIHRRETDREELSQALVRLERALARISRERRVDRAFDSARGKIPWPVEGKLTHRFGASLGDDQRWRGLFITAPEGTEIRAVHSGQVVFSNWLRGFGLLLILDHGGGFMTLYAHAGTIMKRVGEFVSSGEVIATVGNTGGLPESGLYFELRRQGKPTDPVPWLVARN
jgi:septal ring factor EnvC (AmiA/AmiB activator)